MKIQEQPRFSAHRRDGATDIYLRDGDGNLNLTIVPDGEPIPAELRLEAVKEAFGALLDHTADNGLMSRRDRWHRLVDDEHIDAVMSALWDAVPGVPDEE